MATTVKTTPEQVSKHIDKLLSEHLAASDGFPTDEIAWAVVMELADEDSDISNEASVTLEVEALMSRLRSLYAAERPAIPAKAARPGVKGKRASSVKWNSAKKSIFAIPWHTVSGVKPLGELTKADITWSEQNYRDQAGAATVRAEQCANIAALLKKHNKVRVGNLPETEVEEALS